MLNTCIASTDVDLTTTSRVKEVLFGNTTSTVEDALLSNAIRVASRWAETIVGYPLTVQTYQESVSGYGRRKLMLSRTPIRSVDRLFDSTDTGTAAEFLTSEFRVQSREAGFLSRDEGWYWSVPVEADLSARPSVDQEYEPFMADYTAGWTYAGLATSSDNYSTQAGTTSTGRTLPEDIEQAVILKAIAIYEGTDDVVGEQLGDLRVTYRTAAAADQMRPSQYEILLDPYRRIV